MGITLHKWISCSKNHRYHRQHNGEIIHGFTVDNSLNDEVRVTVIATGLDQPENTEVEAVEIKTQENRYQIPDHNYNNPQTSIDILNSNSNTNEDNHVHENTIIEDEVSSSTNEDIPVFGDDLEVPTYLRNRGGE